MIAIFIYNLTMEKIRQALICMTIGMTLFEGGCGAKRGLPPLDVVPYVDLKRYAGTWYEISRYPNSFQEGCVATSATYSLRSDGGIEVLNQCRRKTLEGEISSIKGRAWVADRQSNAKLKVSFFWPFSGPYWIIDLGENYEYAVVGHPRRKYLWVLSRSPRMDEAVYRNILERLKGKSYDIDRLVMTPQPDDGKGTIR
jgi:apolipoprotein D and lipocalin family protein